MNRQTAFWRLASCSSTRILDGLQLASSNRLPSVVHHVLRRPQSPLCLTERSADSVYYDDDASRQNDGHEVQVVTRAFSSCLSVAAWTEAVRAIGGGSHEISIFA